ncbi:Mitochondrial substrate carrier family protein W [Serendipita indica DSM 11827]|nr:Mitochondrial substrate carrier family protein W [Serendipita indica DSM 11827]
MRDSATSGRNSTKAHVFNRSALAGAGAGLVTSIAGCPLDVIKTKLQAQEFAHGTLGYRGVIETTRYVYEKKGIRGFYRGLGPTILGYLPTWAIYFTVYDSVKAYFGEAALGGTRPVVDPDHALDKRHSLALHVFSAMSAGAVSTVCTSPLWVVKTRIMAQPLHEKPYKHTLDCFLTIYRAEGIKAFYRGLLTSLLGITHVAVQFPLYEQLKEWAEQAHPGEDLPYYTILGCSGGSKMVASIATYPHEVIRTRLQMQKRPLRAPSLPGSVNPQVHYHGIVQTAARILQEETWRGLYKGLSINLFRTVPSSAVTMLTYEALMRYLAL